MMHCNILQLVTAVVNKGQFDNNISYISFSFFFSSNQMRLIYFEIILGFLLWVNMTCSIFSVSLIVTNSEAKIITTLFCIKLWKTSCRTNEFHNM